MQDIPDEMEFTAETVEVEEVCEDGVPNKKLKKVVEATFDSKYIAQFGTGDVTECIEIDPQKDTTTATATIEVVKTIAAVVPNTVTTIIASPITPTTATTATAAVIAASPVKNNRSTVKRQIRVMDPNLPAFVCTEHNENISLDCRYCRIASGFKKKNSVQKNVQNNEISSSGKVTVAIPKPRDTNSASVKVQLKQLQKFRPEWLALPEFKDWLVEFKMSSDAGFSQSKCKYCCTLLVNNANNLVRHAISKKHMKNMELGIADNNSAEGQIPPAQKTMVESKDVSKEEIFGRYVASELKRIKSKKTYEEVKWKILQTLQTAAEKEADDPETTFTTKLER